MKPIRLRLLAGLLVTMVAALTTLAMPQILAYFVSQSLSANATVTTVVMAASVVAGLGLLDAALIWLRRYLVVDPSTRLEYRMRTTLFNRLQRLQIAFHDSWESGQLLSRSMADLGRVRRWMSFQSIMLINDVFMILIGVGLMAWANGWLALIYLVGAVPLVLIIVILSLRVRKLSRLAQDRAGDLATTVEQSVHGMRVIKAFGRSDEALQGYTARAEKVRTTEIELGKISAILSAAVMLIPEISLGVALITGLNLVAAGDLTVAGLSLFFATAMLLSMPVLMLGMVITDTFGAITALNRIDEVLDEPLTITDPASPVTPEAEIQGELRFQDVEFRYPGAPVHRTVLSGVNLRIAPGETMALVGVTGSGKTTMLNLVPRLYDVNAGAVTIDGVDVRDFALHTLRTITSVAYEDPTLFSGSVRDNVLLGAQEDLSPTQADSLLDSVLEVADAGFVYELPQGVDTRIGEEGLTLSGGQRQRLAVARAIAAKPKVLVLDDPLSALDTATEERVTARLRTMLEGTTTLIVAHRTSTVALADRVALLDEGRIVAVGTHAQLLASNAQYRFVLADLDAPTAGTR